MPREIRSISISGQMTFVIIDPLAINAPSRRPFPVEAHHFKRIVRLNVTIRFISRREVVGKGFLLKTRTIQ
jgi:hypothetical protein